MNVSFLIDGSDQKVDFSILSSETHSKSLSEPKIYQKQVETKEYLSTIDQPIEFGEGASSAMLIKEINNWEIWPDRKGLTWTGFVVSATPVKLKDGIFIKGAIISRDLEKKGFRDSCYTFSIPAPNKTWVRFPFKRGSGQNMNLYFLISNDGSVPKFK